jgi:muconolactone delta-isomerase
MESSAIWRSTSGRSAASASISVCSCSIASRQCSARFSVSFSGVEGKSYKDGSATVAAMALAPARLERLKVDEKAGAQDLQRDGKWIHLWRVVGRYANVSVFEVADHDELHTILSTLPLLVANKHLSDPDAATRSRECQAALACICARNLMLSIWDRKSSLTF